MEMEILHLKVIILYPEAVDGTAEGGIGWEKIADRYQTDFDWYRFILHSLQYILVYNTLGSHTHK